MENHKEKIKENFSKSAKHYDRYAALQLIMMQKLFIMINGEYRKILDVGSGTGTLTDVLAKRYPAAEIVGLDIAQGMVEVADSRFDNQSVKYIEGDGENLPFYDSTFDLAVSSASLQWMDPEKVFAEVARVLKPDGRFYFSTFGPKTLCELREKGLSVNQFPPKAQLEAALKRLFKRVELKGEIDRKHYNSIRELFSYLKNIGAQNPTNQMNKGLSGRRKSVLDKKEIAITYEIIYANCAK